MNAPSFLALAVYTRSPAAYDALKSFKLLQLPRVRTLKYYIDANLEQAGTSGMSTPREEAAIQPPYHSKRTTTGWAKGQDTNKG